jgi:ketosteroid isomerase-like protein
MSMRPSIVTTLLACAGALVGMVSCGRNNATTQGDRSAEIRAVETTIHNAIGWARTKDFALLHRTIANDSNYREVDPTPGLIRGFAAFKQNEAIWGSPDFKAVRYDIRDLQISLSRGGDVAWFYGQLDDVNEWKGRPASWLNTRWTGVLEKREGRWVIVQMHFSFAQER